MMRRASVGVRGGAQVPIRSAMYFWKAGALRSERDVAVVGAVKMCRASMFREKGLRLAACGLRLAACGLRLAEGYVDRLAVHRNQAASFHRIRKAGDGSRARRPLDRRIASRMSRNRRAHVDEAMRTMASDIATRVSCAAPGPNTAHSARAPPIDRRCPEPGTRAVSRASPHRCVARASSISRSRALSVMSAARWNSACASARRPSFASRSPRTLGSQ
ncbi:Uncharacterised protein [Burkholderia pseudomallei]|nr:Uncharacterised protein [Burkholderia pseudomallei]CAJ2982929.1 Uncharacterised protein [Burkholderia pseudomallei]CAJ2990836.1 Uncharacterised protein [Burkholderia pseudomallei]CAJ3412823.1 Uncharacterised protein [Burkholderia pseudomallei]CAJ3650231.1 Uncharacterised protein [Burkholderia pseudomallei]